MITKLTNTGIFISFTKLSYTLFNQRSFIGCRIGHIKNIQQILRTPQHQMEKVSILSA